MSFLQNQEPQKSLKLSDYSQPHIQGPRAPYLASAYLILDPFIQQKLQNKALAWLRMKHLPRPKQSFTRQYKVLQLDFYALTSMI